MSFITDIAKDRPFVLFVLALILGACSLIFGNIWFLVAALAAGGYAHYSEKKEIKNAKDSS